MSAVSTEYLKSLVNGVVRTSHCFEWIDSSGSNCFRTIGESISAISNAAVLYDRPKAYMVWGIDNEMHRIVGTDFLWKDGNESLVAFLSEKVRPHLSLAFHDVPMDDGRVVLLEIPRAENHPVQFEGVEYIRIGSENRLLSDLPDKKCEFWRRLDSTPFELRLAQGNLTEDEIFALLDFPGYYDGLRLPIPRNAEAILENLQKERFIMRGEDGSWGITNLGALMIAKDLRKFDSLFRKTVRVVWYSGDSRMETVREAEFTRGYAVSYKEVVDYIMTIIPQKEVIVGAVRKSFLSYPETAVRELVANMMIHQDFQQRGTNPMVEVFSTRIEFTNAGAPLVPIDRVVDAVPVSRNENTAAFMQRCSINEERGSGYDRILDSTGESGLLSPRIVNQSNQFTKVILFSKIPFESVMMEDRIRTCYMHASLAFIRSEELSASDVRRIFGLTFKESAKTARIIRTALDAGLIKVSNPSETAAKDIRYIPYWA